MYAVSGRGASVLVGREPQTDPVGLGTFVKVRVSLEEPPPEDESATESPSPRLREEKLVVEAEPTPDAPLEITTVVQSIDPERRELVLSVDSADEAGRDMLVGIADDIDFDDLRVDQALIATISPRDEEPALLTGWADDTGRRGANDAGRAEGDQAP